MINHYVAIPKEIAKGLGMKHYYGKSCIHHDQNPNRYVSDGSCVVCKLVNSNAAKAGKLRTAKELEDYRSDPNEVWLDVPIAEYADNYQVSNKGRVWSKKREVTRDNGSKYIKTGKMMTPTDDGDGYLAVGLTHDRNNKTMRIHRLVMLAFNGEAPLDDEYEINHKDGVKTNNFPDNLEWVTSKENTHHAMEMGLWHHRNEKCAISKLTWEDVDLIREAYEYGSKKFGAVALAEMFNVTSSAIYGVVRNRTWLEEYRDVV